MKGGRGGWMLPGRWGGGEGWGGRRGWMDTVRLVRESESRELVRALEMAGYQ